MPAKALFQLDMDYGYFKDLPRRTASDKVLHDKALILLKIQNMTDMKKVLFQWLINCLMKNCLLLTQKKELVQKTNNYTRRLSEILKNVGYNLL